MEGGFLLRGRGHAMYTINSVIEKAGKIKAEADNRHLKLLADAVLSLAGNCNEMQSKIKRLEEKISERR